MAKHYNINQIMQFLPHRYPFLLIDRILELVPAKKVIALKNVTINEPFFQGHFPCLPIMPGVLIIEAMAQAAGVLAFESLSEEKYGALVYFLGIDKVRFRKPVEPGDQLILDMNLIKHRSKRMFKIGGKATVNDKIVAQAELMASIGEKTT